MNFRKNLIGLFAIIFLTSVLLQENQTWIVCFRLVNHLCWFAVFMLWLCEERQLQLKRVKVTFMASFLIGFEFISLIDSVYTTAMHFVYPELDTGGFLERIDGSNVWYASGCLWAGFLFALVMFFGTLIISEKNIMHQPRLVRWLYFRMKQ